MRKLCAVLMCLGLALNVSAETPSAPAHATPTISQKDSLSSKLDESTSWELEMAEGGYKITQNNKRRDALVAAYERAINQVCMPELLESLEYVGPPEDPDCLLLLKKLEAIYSKSPALLCARLGISSASCEQAYATQIVSTSFHYPSPSRDEANPLDDPQFEADMSAEKNKKKLAQLESEASELKRTFDQKQDERLMFQVHALYGKMLALVCTGSRLGLTEIKAAPLPNARKGANDKNPNILGKITQSLKENIVQPATDLAKGATPLPTATQSSVTVSALGEGAESATYERTRVLSSACLRSIGKALDIDKNMPAAICAREGDYTPRCIKARRVDRAKRKSLAHDGEKPQPDRKGFDTF